MNKQMIGVLNFVLTVIGAFAFGYKAVEYTLYTPNLPAVSPHITCIFKTKWLNVVVTLLEMSVSTYISDLDRKIVFISRHHEFSKLVKALWGSVS